MMKRFLTIMIAIIAVSMGLGGCAGTPQAQQNLVSSEQTVLSREEENPLVPEGEYPDPNDDKALGVLPSSEGSSQPSSSSSEAPSQADESSQSQTADSASSSEAAESQREEPASSSEPEASPQEEAASKQEGSTASSAQEVRAVWLSYLDLGPLLSGRSEAQFTASIQQAFDNCAGIGLNTVFVQVRPFGDALYRSNYFPWSYLVSANKTEGEDPGYDPLAIMVSEAHKRGLSIEAWLNPYRIRASGYKYGLCDDNPAQEWLDAGSDYVVEYEGGIYYNPAREEVQTLIVKGVQEIVANYQVDGIHFDDYFYPSPDETFDAEAYGEYIAGGGNKSLSDWRRSNVDTLVKKVYSTVKSIRSSCKFGISPTGNHSNNYNLQYADVEKWCSTTGYVDYICPQIYWGYQNSSAPFQSTLESWEEIISSPQVDLYVGLAAYKVGGSERDFADSTDILMRQVLSSREQGHYKGFSLYRYDSLFNASSNVQAQISTELENLQSIL